VEKDGYVKVVLADNPQSNTVSNDLIVNIQSVDTDSTSITKSGSIDTTTTKNVADSTSLNSDTTIAVSKLTAIRATKTSISTADSVNITIFSNSSLSGNVTQQEITDKGKSLLAQNPGLFLQNPPPGVSATCQ
jgi:hypothetical protein